jgi:hypothetical protein
MSKSPLGRFPVIGDQKIAPERFAFNLKRKTL